MPSDLTVTHADVITEHREWLQKFGNERLKKWEDLLKSNPEGAICEASTRKLLSEHRIVVEPYEEPSHGGPDFLCSRKGEVFYTEVTCITKEKVIRKTGLNDIFEGSAEHRAQYYSLLTEAFKGELCDKASQCSNLNKPCIVVIGTFHCRAGHCCFGKRGSEDLLTGTSQIAMRYDPVQGKGVGNIYETTDLRDSAFIRFQKSLNGQVECARNPISAVLLCSFNPKTEAVGILHPNPNHCFDRNLMPDIEFVRLREGYKQTGKLNVEWI